MKLKFPIEFVSRIAYTLERPRLIPHFIATTQTQLSCFILNLHSSPPYLQVVTRLPLLSWLNSSKKESNRVWVSHNSAVIMTLATSLITWSLLIKINYKIRFAHFTQIQLHCSSIIKRTHSFVSHLQTAFNVPVEIHELHSNKIKVSQNRGQISNRMNWKLNLFTKKIT